MARQSHTTSVFVGDVDVVVEARPVPEDKTRYTVRCTVMRRKKGADNVLLAEVFGSITKDVMNPRTSEWRIHLVDERSKEHFAYAGALGAAVYDIGRMAAKPYVTKEA